MQTTTVPHVWQAGKPRASLASSQHQTAEGVVPRTYVQVVESPGVSCSVHPEMNHPESSGVLLGPQSLSLLLVSNWTDSREIYCCVWKQEEPARLEGSEATLVSFLPSSQACVE